MSWPTSASPDLQNAEGIQKRNESFNGQGDSTHDTLETFTGSPITSALNQNERLISRSFSPTPRTSTGHNVSLTKYQGQPFSFNREDVVQDFSNVSISHSPFSISAPLLCSSRIVDGNCSFANSDISTSTMDVFELRSTLDEIVMENSTLKSELQLKNRQLRNAKMQVKALLDLDASLQLENASSPADAEGQDLDLRLYELIERNRELMSKSANLTSTAADTNTLRNYDQENAPEVPVRILPENTFVFIREITSRIEIHQVRERMIEGIHISNQLIGGGMTGWCGAYLLKNFGKTALTAVVGGSLLVFFAHQKGFVDVNWGQVCQEIQRHQGFQGQKNPNSADGPNGDESISPEPNDDWTAGKIRKIKNWINDHSVTAVGFIGGFMYSIL